MTTRTSKTTTKTAASKTSRLRKMKTYKPRRRVKTAAMNNQELEDLERRISSDIGSFLVLLEQGNAEQVSEASQKARSDFLKIGPDMQKLANRMGGIFPKFVGDFLISIDNILHTGTNWLDDAKIKDCYSATQRLEEALRLRAAKLKK